MMSEFKARKAARFLALVFPFLAVSVVHGRSADQTIKLIRYPISTRPVIVLAGDQFVVELQNNIDIAGVKAFLVSDATEIAIFESDIHAVYEVEDRSTFDLPTWECLVDGWKMSWMWRPRVIVHDLVRVPIVLPEDVPAGFYGLRMQCSAGSDTNPRAVRVLKEWPKEYTIVQVTDTHLGRKGSNAVAHLTRIGDAINALQPEFVLLTGDITDDNYPQDHETYVSLIDRIKVPTFSVGGNHDNGGRVYSGHADQLLYYDRPYYSFDFGDHHYIGIDNASRLFDEQQVAWIKENLKNAMTKDARFLFGHALYLQSKEDDHWFHNVLFEEYDVGLNLHGHWHRDEFRWIRDGKTAWVCSAAVVDTPRYTVLTIRDNRVMEVDFRSASPIEDE
jgi:predicted phosphodiesterase